MRPSVELLRLGDPRADRLGQALGRSFHDEPNFTYMLPDVAVRAEALAWFFGTFVARLGLRYGAVHVTEQASGGAVWMRPGSNVSFVGAVRAGLLQMPFHLGWGGFLRSMRVNGYLEKVRERVAPAHHWYLAALGVDPGEQGRGLGGALIQPVLARADAGGIPCYLETFGKHNVSFYRRHGFEVTAEERVPKAGLPFWSMTRAPQSPRP